MPLLVGVATGPVGGEGQGDVREGGRVRWDVDPEVVRLGPLELRAGHDADVDGEEAAAVGAGPARHHGRRAARVTVAVAGPVQKVRITPFFPGL